MRRIAIAIIENPAFTRSFTENPVWHRQFFRRNNRMLKGGPRTVQHDMTDSCCLYVTKKKAMNFQDNILSIPVDDFKDNYVLVFDITAKTGTTEHYHYLEFLKNHSDWNFTLVPH